VHKLWKGFVIVCLLASGTVWARGAVAASQVKIRIPEILVLYLDQKPGTTLPVRVNNGAVVPSSVQVRVVANTDWVLWVQASPLTGPVALPPERLSIGDLRLSSLPQALARGRGPFVRRYALSVELEPGEPPGAYRGTITFNLARP